MVFIVQAKVSMKCTACSINNILDHYGGTSPHVLSMNIFGIKWYICEVMFVKFN